MTNNNKKPTCWENALAQQKTVGDALAPAIQKKKNGKSMFFSHRNP